MERENERDSRQLHGAGRCGARVIKRRLCEGCSRLLPEEWRGRGCNQGGEKSTGRDAGEARRSA